MTEVGSEWNRNRPELRMLLSDAAVTTIVVEHRDWLARFGVEYLEAALSAQSRRVVVLDTSEVADDLVREVPEVVTCMCLAVWARVGCETC